MLFIEGEKKPVLTGAGLAFVRKRYSDEIVFLSGKIFIWSGKMFACSNIIIVIIIIIIIIIIILLIIFIIIILLIISLFFPVLYIKGKTVAFVH